jgi:hypothetical protein
MPLGRSLIALDCDGTVEGANGPIPMALIQRMAARHHVFIIGNKALCAATGLPCAGSLDGQFCSGLEYTPGGKSAALKRWAEYYPQFQLRFVIDDTPAQYLNGWDGWAFFSPRDFLAKVAPLL